MPSARYISGFHPRSAFALKISGHLRLGSSITAKSATAKPSKIRRNVGINQKFDDGVKAQRTSEPISHLDDVADCSWL